jgi:Tfp pilus assembly protein FimT
MKLIKQNFGFSLAEMVTVIAVMMIMMSIVMVDYNASGKKSAVISAAQAMVSNIRKAQSYALGGKNINNNAGRWGLYFSKASSSYVLFTDTNKDNLYQNSEAYLKIDLPTGVIIDDFLNGGTSVSLICIPPGPKVIIKNDSTATSSEDIILLSGGNKKRVNINNFGLVDINDY